MPLASCIQTTFKEGVLLSIEVQPGASHNGIGTVNTWRSRRNVSVQTNAERGLANRAVIDCFSRVLDLQKTSISIVAGHTSRKKTVRFENISEGELLTLLKQETGEA